MSIRPIDVQIMVHKASEVSKFNNADSQTAAAKQGQFAQEFKKEVETQGQQVTNPHSAEKAQVDKDGRGGASYSNKRGSKDGSKNSEKDAKDEQANVKPMFKNEQGRFSAKA